MSIMNDDDAVLDARDMAEEIAGSRKVFEAMDTRDYPATCDKCGTEGTNESMQTHECAADRKVRQFPDVINQWTQACLQENRAALDPATILLITRLGTLGQRLIYESNSIGMYDAAKLAIKEML